MLLCGVEREDRLVSAWWVSMLGELCGVLVLWWLCVREPCRGLACGHWACGGRWVQECGPICGGVFPCWWDVVLRRIGGRWGEALGCVSALGGLVGWNSAHRGALCYLYQGLERSFGCWGSLGFPWWFREVAWWG